LPLSRADPGDQRREPLPAAAVLLDKVSCHQTNHRLSLRAVHLAAVPVPQNRASPRKQDKRGRVLLRAFEQLIERARREGDGRARLELFHQADRMAVADHVALVPIYYMRVARYSIAGTRAGQVN